MVAALEGPNCDLAPLGLAVVTEELMHFAHRLIGALNFLETAFYSCTIKGCSAWGRVSFNPITVFPPAQISNRVLNYIHRNLI